MSEENGTPQRSSPPTLSVPGEEEIARAICGAMFTEEDHGEDRCCQLGGTAGCCVNDLMPEARAVLKLFPAPIQEASPAAEMSEPRPESKYPTILDMRDHLSALIECGYGELPVQILVAPDSTIQILATDMGGPGHKPAIMVDLGAREGRLPVSIISADRLSGRGIPSIGKQ